jgi:hypothetical protein
MQRIFPLTIANITSEPFFEESGVVDYGNPNSTGVDKSHRDSSTAFLDLPHNPPESDADIVVSCIEQRASQFQGHVPVNNMENLQVVK